MDENASVTDEVKEYVTDSVRYIAETADVDMKTVAIVLGVLIPLLVFGLIGAVVGVVCCYKKKQCCFKPKASGVKEDKSVKYLDKDATLKTQENLTTPKRKPV